jgi:hypothetical protein
VFALLFTTSALALSPACDGPLSQQDWKIALSAADRYLVARDFINAKRLVEWTHKRVPCLEVLVAPTEVARFAQHAAFIATLDEDTDQAESWARLAATSIVKPPAPTWLPDGHIGLQVLEGAQSAQWFEPREGHLVAPTGGGLFLNGQLILEPHAPTETPYVLQRINRSGVVESTDWHLGDPFDRHLVDSEAKKAPSVPKWWSLETQSYALRKPIGSDPEAIWMVGLASASAALYGTSWATRSMYDDDPSEALYTTTNTMLLASTLLGGASVGMLSARLVKRTSR